MSEPVTEVVCLPATHVSVAHVDGSRHLHDRPETRIETTLWGSGPPEIVLLHDGLGSIAQWHGVPAAVAKATGRTVLAYNRPGHGGSLPTPSGAWPSTWLNEQAVLLGELLSVLGADRPYVVGHSDGGTIALLYAAANESLSGVLALSSHVFVEQRCVDAIVEMRVAPAKVVRGLAKVHSNAEALFQAWSGGWTHSSYRPWDSRPLLGSITCPAHVAQGGADEYATEEMVWGAVKSMTATQATGQLLPGLGHMVPLEDPKGTIKLIADFVTGA